jgi:hypothetical protein
MARVDRSGSLRCVCDWGNSKFAPFRGLRHPRRYWPLLLRTAALPLQNSSANRVRVRSGRHLSPLSSDATARELPRTAKRNPHLKTKQESFRELRQHTAVKAATISGPAYRPALTVNHRQSSRRPPWPRKTRSHCPNRHGWQRDCRRDPQRHGRDDRCLRRPRPWRGFRCPRPSGAA